MARLLPIRTHHPCQRARRVNTYRLETVNRCGIAIHSQAASTMVLAGQATEATQQVSLSWTPYVPGSTLFGGYKVTRKLDGAADFNLAPQGGTSATTWMEAVGGDGFAQCYRIIAAGAADGIVSYSNTICLTFENALIFYNVVTPNGDGANDVLGFKNVKLYPDNTLRVVNRWGREIYKADSYQGDWDVAGLSAGTYFYEFSVSGATHKGWFEVVR